MSENWEACPKCKADRISECNCPCMQSTCENDHWWFLCLTCKKVVIGKRDHKTTLAFQCHCPQSNFLKGEFEKLPELKIKQFKELVKEEVDKDDNKLVEKIIFTEKKNKNRKTLIKWLNNYAKH